MNIDYSLFPTANPVVYAELCMELYCSYNICVQLFNSSVIRRVNTFFHSILVGQIFRLSSLWIYWNRISQVEWTCWDVYITYDIHRDSGFIVKLFFYKESNCQQKWLWLIIEWIHLSNYSKRKKKSRYVHTPLLIIESVEWIFGSILEFGSQ